MVKNAFAILKSRFGIFQSLLQHLLTIRYPTAQQEDFGGGGGGGGGGEGQSTSARGQ